MRNILTWSPISTLLVLSALALAGCAGEEKSDEYQTSRLEDLPFVYKMTVQQGNLLSEDQVDQLQLGMTKNQVRYLLGTPLLTDFFHTNRWDYVYTIQRGHQAMEEKNLTVYFENDALVRIEGDLKPNPGRAAAARESREIVVSVPESKKRKSWIRRGLEAIGAD